MEDILREIEDILREIEDILREIEDILREIEDILREIEDIAHSSSNFKAASLRVEGVSGPTLALLTSDNGGSNPEQVSEVLSVLLLGLSLSTTDPVRSMKSPIFIPL